MIKFKFDGEHLLILQEGDTLEHPSYWMSISDMARIDDKKLRTSFWVIDLSGYPWVPKSSLYYLGYLIQQRHPNNQIDWVQTYMRVESDAQISNLYHSIVEQQGLRGVYGSIEKVKADYAYMLAFKEFHLGQGIKQAATEVQKNARKNKVKLNKI